jgi:hypothetical protein
MEREQSGYRPRMQQSAAARARPHLRTQHRGARLPDPPLAIAYVTRIVSQAMPSLPKVRLEDAGREATPAVLVRDDRSSYPALTSPSVSGTV